jgi:Erythromycin biosynthesis protein CIII-like, C-terminal domain
MVSPKRILVLGTSHGGGDWPPLAAVTVGLHQAGHAVQCFGDAAIAHDCASMAIPVEVGPAADALGALMARWRAAGAAGPPPLRAWADACWPAVRALVSAFRPELVLSQFFTMELARLTKAACGLRWCCINPAYYFGPDSTRAFEADFVGPARPLFRQAIQAVGEADLVLHGTDALFDPPPPSFPRHHHHVGPLMWEPISEAPPYLDVPGAPWALVTVSSLPQPGEMTLAGIALQTLAELPVRVVLTLSAGHPRDELGTVPANARLEQFVPHSAVLKRSGLLVSHAGHGIVAKARYYGVPMVLVPWGRDQPGVAARAAALGVAEVVTRDDLTGPRLAAAIHRVLSTPRYQENASRIAGRLQTRDAVAIARARIEELLETT